MIRNFEHRYRAVRSRHARFDGWFYIAVPRPGSTAARAVRPSPRSARSSAHGILPSEIAQLYAALLHFVVAGFGLLAADKVYGAAVTDSFTTLNTNFAEFSF